MPEPVASYSRYFDLDEAARLLPHYIQLWKQAKAELDEHYQTLILAKRIYTLKHIEGQLGHKTIEKELKRKLKQFERAHLRWRARFKAEGVELRDIEKGRLEFPYLTQDGDTLLLSWTAKDPQGLFYFREPDESMKQRKPITVLPN